MISGMLKFKSIDPAWESVIADWVAQHEPNPERMLTLFISRHCPVCGVAVGSCRTRRGHKRHAHRNRPGQAGAWKLSGVKLSYSGWFKP